MSQKTKNACVLFLHTYICGVKNPASRNANSAFTLIELLVVITIIGILVAVALPVYAGVLERANATKDANALKQIGTALLSYLQDNDEQMFPTTPASAADLTWPVTLKTKYLSNWNIFQSPFDKRPNAGAADKGYNVSYGINTRTYDKNLSKWASPTLTIVVAPMLSGPPETLASWAGTCDSNVTRTVPTATALGTHGKQKKINVLYGDFHVEAGLIWSKFSKDGGTNDEDKYRWTPY
jgi:prepilin-type N-terminal cleavage/methylation domain-containing protein/prepilin-type processing-associated H-X9-DG protein